MRIVENIVELQRRIALYDDEPAYKEIFFTYHTALLRFAQTFVDDRQCAEEIVSDVMMKIWEKRKDLQSIANLRVYLYISTKNTALNYLAIFLPINSQVRSCSIIVSGVKYTDRDIIVIY